MADKWSQFELQDVAPSVDKWSQFDSPVGEWDETDVISPTQEGVRPEGVNFDQRVMVGNIPEDFHNVALGVSGAMQRPVETGKAIASFGGDLVTQASETVTNILPGQTEQVDYDTPTLDAVTDELVKNYGSVDGFKQHVMNNPVVAALDIAGLYYGGVKPGIIKPGAKKLATEAEKRMPAYIESQTKSIDNEIDTLHPYQSEEAFGVAVEEAVIKREFRAKEFDEYHAKSLAKDTEPNNTIKIWLRPKTLQIQLFAKRKLRFLRRIKKHTLTAHNYRVHLQAHRTSLKLIKS